MSDEATEMPESIQQRVMAEAMFEESMSRKLDPDAKASGGFYLLARKAIDGLEAAGFTIVRREGRN